MNFGVVETMKALAATVYRQHTTCFRVDSELAERNGLNLALRHHPGPPSDPLPPEAQP